MIYHHLNGGEYERRIAEEVEEEMSRRMWKKQLLRGR